MTYYYTFAVGETGGPKECRYQACFDDFDLDCKTGMGPTPEEAIIELLEMHGDQLVRFSR
jgi:hypothetical protein